MPPPTLEISGSAIVLLGSFNPVIFQPQWFAKQGLLSQEEADNANIQVIHPQVSQFDTEHFLFQVTLQRFTALTKPIAIDATLRDVVSGAFYILEHTPITAIGLNKQMHYAVHSEETWHKVGDKLVPKDDWNGLVDGRPGMRNLQVMFPAKSPELAVTTVTVQPSVKVTPGVYFEVNYHYAQQGDNGVNNLLVLLGTKWEETLRDADRIVNHILDWTTA